MKKRIKVKEFEAFSYCPNCGQKIDVEDTLNDLLDMINEEEIFEGKKLRIRKDCVLEDREFFMIIREKEDR